MVMKTMTAVQSLWNTENYIFKFHILQLCSKFSQAYFYYEAKINVWPIIFSNQKNGP